MCNYVYYNHIFSLDFSRNLSMLIAIVRQMVYNIINILGASGYRTKTDDTGARAVPFRDSISCALSVALPCGRAVLF